MLLIVDFKQDSKKRKLVSLVYVGGGGGGGGGRGRGWGGVVYFYCKEPGYTNLFFFSAIFVKGDKFCDFMYAFLQISSPEKDPNLKRKEFAKNLANSHSE